MVLLYMCQVGSVIRNPEIAALVPTLLISIADPNEHTKTSLELLLQVWLRTLTFCGPDESLVDQTWSLTHFLGV